ncbi:MAG: hypothetical protein IV090_24655 [Candidatus Sericytochromatia bacterium]|nr:hypothetical protein [Candidatus Sericytochromatia bacterium]
MTFAGELSARFTWDGMKKAMDQFNGYMKHAERLTGMSTTQMVLKTFQAASKMEGILGRSSGRISKMLQWSVRVSGLSQTKSELASVEKKALGVGSILKGLAVGVGIHQGFGAAKAGAGFTLKTAMNFEDLLAGLHTATGSKGAAEKEFSRLQGYAASTPFSIEQAVSTFTRLKNLDLDSSSRSMNAYGNIAAAVPGKSIMDFTEAVADGVMGEFERLKEFGIKGRKQDGNVTLRFRGQDFKAAAKNGEIDPKAVEEQLRIISEKFFSGAMERRSKTFGGAVSNLSDSIQIAAFKMWRAGLDKPVVAAVRNMTELIQKNIPQIEAFGKMAGKYLGDFFTKLPDYLAKAKQLMPTIVKGIGLIVLGMATMKAIGMGFAIASVIAKFMLLRSAFKLITPVLGLLVKGAGGLLPLLGQWLGRILVAGLGVSAVVIGVASAIAALGYLGYRLYLYFTQGSKSLDDLRVKFPWLADSIQRTGDYLKQWWPHLKVAGMMIRELLIGETNSLAQVVKWAFFRVIIPVVQGAIEVLAWFADKVRVAYEFYMPGLVKQFYLVKDFWVDFWAWIEPVLKSFWKWLSDIGGVTGAAIKLAKQLMGIQDDGDSGASGAALTAVQGNILQTAKNFANGAAGQSSADKWAKSDATMNGLSVRQLYIKGVACDISAEKVVGDAGASKAVLDAMVSRVPDTFNNLLNRGLAELVPASQLRGGELFYAPGMTHTGIVGEGGRTLLHAANSQGHKIGMGQRFSSTSNYLGPGAKYLRIKPEQMGAGTQSVQMPMRGSGGPLANPPAAPVTANTSQNFIFNMGLNTSPQALAGQVGAAANKGVSTALQTAITVPVPTGKK